MDGSDPSEDLFMAIVTQDDDAVAAALARGGDPTVANAAGMTALHVACGAADAEDIVEALLRHGAKPATRDMNGWSSLMYASSGGQHKVVRMLLDSGECSIHAATTCDSGWTALTRACQRGHVAVVKLLLAAMGGETDAAADSPAAEASGHASPVLAPRADLVKALAVAEALDHGECAAAVRAALEALGSPTAAAAGEA